MAIIHPTPELSKGDRQKSVRKIRLAATDSVHATAHAPQTTSNADESKFGNYFPANFTKGLAHCDAGFVQDGYPEFVTQINQDSQSDFETVKPILANDPGSTYTTRLSQPDDDGKDIPSWRGWESPRTGHYYDLEGPDSNAVGMAPAPELGSTELSAEMAEVYAMAILRDVPFNQIEDGTGSDINTALDVDSVVYALKELPYFSGTGADTAFSKRRLAARLIDPCDYDIETGISSNALPPLSSKLLFRGSGPGAKAGPVISQFMLLGNSAGAVVAGSEGHTTSAAASPLAGYIAYGNQFIDQRNRVFLPRLDYMTDWNQWLDVQNGADMRGQHVFDSHRRFIATPRHLATYVRFDALYQAYLNACLLLLESGFNTQSGFPEQNNAPRTGFASFGGPHILSLVTEVATRCLKLARRQKFNFHRRARPERVSALLAMVNAIESGDLSQPNNFDDEAVTAVSAMLSTMPKMTGMIGHHNTLRESGTNSNSHKRKFGNKSGTTQPGWLSNNNSKNNLLLPMAFPEGSPMHPSYAAGHATVAGGCVTMLKAFFETLEDGNGKPVPWKATGLPLVRPDNEGMALETIDDSNVTVEGELNKLAANISIARNMAGVHYYSDYYDSLRMGERVAVGIMVEQMLTYDHDTVTKRFHSFDGDFIEISTEHQGYASINGDVSKDAYLKWWYRHMSTDEILHS